MKLKNVLLEIISEREHGFYQFLPDIDKKLNVKSGPEIGNGTMSDVFDLGDKVLKITSTPDDIGGLYIGQQNPEYPIPKVYSLYRIPKQQSSKTSDTDPSFLSKGDLYVAVVEKVKPIKATDSQEYALYNWFMGNTEFEPNDITPENIGKDSNGRLVYLDPDFVGSGRYARKIPTLK